MAAEVLAHSGARRTAGEFVARCSTGYLRRFADVCVAVVPYGSLAFDAPPAAPSFDEVAECIVGATCRAAPIVLIGVDA